MHWLLLALALFAASFTGGVLIGLKRPRTSIAVLAVAIVLIFLRILWRLYPHWEYRLFPFDRYVEIRVWWVFVPALLAIGVGAARMGTKRARVGVGALGALLWLAAAQRLWLSFMLPQDEMTGVADRNGVVRQTTDYTCGAAAAATVLAQLGQPRTERDMSEACGTNAFSGTDEFGVARGLRRKLGPGWTVDVRGAEWEDLKRAPLPAAVTIRYVPWIDHWVVVLEVRDGAVPVVVVGDPVNGRKTMSKEEFMGKWRKVMVTVEKNGKKAER